MQEKTENIKKLAKAAKSRMKSGFWEDVKRRRSDDVADALAEGKSAEKVIKDYSLMLKSKIYQETSDEDEAFYLKVCELLNSDEVITNPLMRLADETTLAAMTDIARHHYILEISNKYKEMKERYEQENALEIKCK